MNLMGGRRDSLSQKYKTLVNVQRTDLQGHRHTLSGLLTNFPRTIEDQLGYYHLVIPEPAIDYSGIVNRGLWSK